MKNSYISIFIFGLQLLAGSSSSNSCYDAGDYGNGNASSSSSSWERPLLRSIAAEINTESDEHNADPFKFITDRLNDRLSGLSLTSSSSSSDQHIRKELKGIGGSSELQNKLESLKSEIEIKEVEVQSLVSAIEETKSDNEPKRDRIQKEIQLLDEKIQELNKIMSEVGKLEKLDGAVFKDGKNNITLKEVNKIAKKHLDFQSADNNITINGKAKQKLKTTKNDLKVKQIERADKVKELNLLKSDKLAKLQEDLVSKNQELKIANNELKKLTKELKAEKEKEEEKARKKEEKRKEEAKRKIKQEAELAFQNSVIKNIEREKSDFRKEECKKNLNTKFLEIKGSLESKLEEYFKEPEYSEYAKSLKEAYDGIEGIYYQVDKLLKEVQDSESIPELLSMVPRLNALNNARDAFQNHSLVEINQRKKIHQNELLGDNHMVQLFAIGSVLLFSAEFRGLLDNLFKKFSRQLMEKNTSTRELGALKEKTSYFPIFENPDKVIFEALLNDFNQLTKQNEKCYQISLEIDQTLREILEFLKAN